MNELILSKLEVGTLDASTNDLSAVTRGFQVAPVTMTPAATVTVNAADHSGRPLLIESIATGSGADNYVLPTPSFIGETYNFMWSAIIADGDNLIFRSASADGLTFTGGFLDFDTDDAGVAGYVICHPTSADDDRLTITDPENFNITFMATSLTNYHCTGYIMSTGTASAFDDQ